MKVFGVILLVLACALMVYELVMFIKQVIDRKKAKKKANNDVKDSTIK